MSAPMSAATTIGVFDSGVGGLTVLRALRARLPDYSFLYLGDSARLPYGTKSADTVRRYALQAASVLVSRDVQALVVACNTASAVALDDLAARWPSLPVLGVIEPGARAAVAKTRNGCIGVIGTESTIRGEAYQRAIDALAPSVGMPLRVHARACSVFVALAEEGWFDTPAAEAVARAYLQDWFDTPAAEAEAVARAGAHPDTHANTQAGTYADSGIRGHADTHADSSIGADSDARAGHRAANETLVPDTLVLGCTHFPVLREVIGRVVGPAVTLVDSATTTAEALAQRLGATRASVASSPRGRLGLLATDGPERFAAVGSRFMGEFITPEQVEIVDL